ncbi:hypothetical protein J6590_066009 [Homalodisca vitripennis]|nr:hypothetical protein J6590_066009 [Homalodisca vitripennis]
MEKYNGETKKNRFLSTYCDFVNNIYLALKTFQWPEDYTDSAPHTADTNSLSLLSGPAGPFGLIPQITLSIH